MSPFGKRGLRCYPQLRVLSLIFWHFFVRSLSLEAFVCAPRPEFLGEGSAFVSFPSSTFLKGLRCTLSFFLIVPLMRVVLFISVLTVKKSPNGLILFFDKFPMEWSKTREFSLNSHFKLILFLGSLQHLIPSTRAADIGVQKPQITLIVLTVLGQLF